MLLKFLRRQMVICRCCWAVTGLRTHVSCLANLLHARVLAHANRAAALFMQSDPTGMDLHLQTDIDISVTCNVHRWPAHSGQGTAESALSRLHKLSPQQLPDCQYVTASPLTAAHHMPGWILFCKGARCLRSVRALKCARGCRIRSSSACLLKYGFQTAV